MQYDTYPELFIPIGFAGGLVDRHTGLVRFGFRDYMPELGRFTCPDPLGDTGGDHDLYDYCVDDPVNMVDPEGLRGTSVHRHKDDKTLEALRGFVDPITVVKKGGLLLAKPVFMGGAYLADALSTVMTQEDGGTAVLKDIIFEQDGISMYSPERGGTYRERPNTSKIYYRSGMSTQVRDEVRKDLKDVMPIVEAVSGTSILRVDDAKNLIKIVKDKKDKK